MVLEWDVKHQIKHANKSKIESFAVILGENLHTFTLVYVKVVQWPRLYRSKDTEFIA